MGKVIGESGDDELDPDAPRLPSIVPDHVPERVARRRRRLRDLRRRQEPEQPEETGEPG